MLLFDAKGHLTPYNCIQTDWQTFMGTFGWTKHRQLIIASLQSFIDRLGSLSINVFDLWIDGSFVTHKSQPKDIDVVFFLPTSSYRMYEQALRTIRNEFSELDVYFVRKIAEGDREHFLYLADKAEWLFQFSMTKPDRRTRRKYPKGFLQISWTDEQTLESKQ